MHRIAFANQKGGPGKTTLTELIAVEAERVGDGPVCIVDTDPQGSMTRWHSLREAATPQIAPIPYECLGEVTFANLAAKGARMLFFDTQPDRTDYTFAILKLCDLVVVPLKPSHNDIWAAADTFNFLKQNNIPFVFCLNMTKPNVAATAQVAAELSHHGPVLQTFVGDRTAYVNAVGRGMTGAEEDSKKAAPEIAALYQNIRTFLHKSKESSNHVSMGAA